MRLSEKPIKLTAYTYKHDWMEFGRFLQGNSMTPSWHKTLPSRDKPGRSTMKGCAGFIDYHRRGFLIPLWTDIEVWIAKEGEEGWGTQSADCRTMVEVHSPMQSNNHINGDTHQHLKIVSPWILHCEEDVPFLATNADWYRKDPYQFIVPNGVVNFKHQASTNVHLLMRKEKDEQTYIMDHGSPLVHYIPMSERPVEIEYKLVTEAEWGDLMLKYRPSCWFERNYYKAKALRKKMLGR